MDEEPSTSKGVGKRRSVCQKRKRSPSPTVTENVRATWKKDEKLKLFEAVKIHGHKELEKLAKAVGTKTERQVASYLRGREIEVKAKLKSRDKSTFDQWLDATRKITDKKKDYSHLLSKAISLVTQQESGDDSQIDANQPKKGDVRPNVDEIYKYLNSTITGKDFSELNSQNGKALSDLSKMLNNIVNDVTSELNEEIEFMSTWTKENVRDQRGMKANATVTNSEALFSLNPFNIPVSILKEVHDKVTSSSSYTKHIEEFAQMYKNM